MTSRLEKDMDGIAGSQMQKDDVLRESREMLDKVFDQLETHGGEIGRMLRAGSAVDSPIGPCPLCGSPLVVRTRKSDGNKFIACSGFPACRNTFNVPPGSLRFDKKICEKHKLHLIKVTPPSTAMADGKKVKAKAYEYGCPACKKEGAGPVIASGKPTDIPAQK
jgi:DNA topoisomerase-1